MFCYTYFFDFCFDFDFFCPRITRIETNYENKGFPYPFLIFDLFLHQRKCTTFFEKNMLHNIKSYIFAPSF